MVTSTSSNRCGVKPLFATQTLRRRVIFAAATEGLARTSGKGPFRHSLGAKPLLLLGKRRSAAMFEKRKHSRATGRGLRTEQVGHAALAYVSRLPPNDAAHAKLPLPTTRVPASRTTREVS
jgi:hypothetical protein